MIENIEAKETKDSRGRPTVLCQIKTETGLYSASVPSGASTGSSEALELRDKNGSVNQAIKNVNNIIAKELLGSNETNQKQIDEKLINLDGTENKSKLGANAILSVSMACAKAGANSNDLQLYEYIGKLSGNRKFVLPIPQVNIIEGGVHAENKLDIQEFLIAPLEAKNFNEAMNTFKVVYKLTGELLKKKYKTTKGMEGGFCPQASKTRDILDTIIKAIEKSGYDKEVKIALDVAASELFDGKKYQLDGKKTREELVQYYKKLIRDYPIYSIEDPFAEEDWTGFSKLTKETDIQIVGDDLLTTNPSRIKLAIGKKACNALLLKINQIGTITEAIKSFHLAGDWSTIVSHRSGETMDTFIADLAVGLGCGQIKTGSLSQKERAVKYNRLMEISDSVNEYGLSE